MSSSRSSSILLGEWREPSRKADTVLRADPIATTRALTERLGRLRPGASAVAGAPFAAAWLDADRAVREEVDGRLGALDELSEPGVWIALAAALRDGDSVLAASSMPVRDVETFLRPGPDGVRFVSNRGANGIDGLVSTAAGLAAGSGARTWAVLGDLALFHDLGGLAAARHAPELRLIVIDNSGGGIFHFLPQAEAMPEEEFEPLLGTPYRVDPVKAAELFGFASKVPSTPGELRRGAGWRRANDRRSHRPPPKPRAASRPRRGRGGVRSARLGRSRHGTQLCHP